MEKKEPVLTAENEETSSAEVQEIKVTEQSENDKVVTTSTKEKKPLLKKLSKTTWIIAGVILLLVIIAIFALCIPSEKSNVANVGEKSVFEKLFGKKEKSEIIAPSFDIVRMEKGEVVIAGQAGKEAIVHILDNGKELGSEKADANGQWVFIPKHALPIGNRKLSLYVLDDNGNKIYSKQSAVLHVSKKSSDEVAVLVGKTKKGPKSRILKSSTKTNGSPVRVAKIDYDDNGAFIVEGLAKRGATVNIYMNNKIVGTVDADSVGVFKLDTKYEMKAEENTLRVDMLGKNGKVIARVAYKFTPVMIESENTMTVVKKGDCLWNIALREYGRGSAYVIIFEANKSQIQDPDKIYVGQVFNVVKKDGEAFTKFATEAKDDASAKSKMADRFGAPRVATKSATKVETQKVAKPTQKPAVKPVAKKPVARKPLIREPAPRKSAPKTNEAGSQPVKLIRD